MGSPFSSGVMLSYGALDHEQLINIPLEEVAL